MSSLSSNKLGFPIALGVVWALMLVLTLICFAGFTNSTVRPSAAVAAVKAPHQSPAGRAPHR